LIFNPASVHDRTQPYLHTFHVFEALIKSIDSDLAVVIFPATYSLARLLFATVKIGQIYQREPSASFLAVVEPDWTYTKLFELAVEYGYLGKEMFDFVRFLVQVKRKIESIMDAEAQFADQITYIRLDIISEDQRTMDSEKERLCQLSFVGDSTSWPVLFRLIQGECLNDFLARVATSFRLEQPNLDRTQLYQPAETHGPAHRLAPDDVPGTYIKSHFKW
jgi:hypothetical protein